MTFLSQYACTYIVHITEKTYHHCNRQEYSTNISWISQQLEGGEKSEKDEYREDHSIQFPGGKAYTTRTLCCTMMWYTWVVNERAVNGCIGCVINGRLIRVQCKACECPLHEKDRDRKKMEKSGQHLLIHVHTCVEIYRTLISTVQTCWCLSAGPSLYQISTENMLHCHEFHTTHIM